MRHPGRADDRADGEVELARDHEERDRHSQNAERRRGVEHGSGALGTAECGARGQREEEPDEHRAERPRPARGVTAALSADALLGQGDDVGRRSPG